MAAKAVVSNIFNRDLSFALSFVRKTVLNGQDLKKKTLSVPVPTETYFPLQPESHNTTKLKVISLNSAFDAV